MDYEGITLVVQLGLPSSREIYIHRLGRTGRAGKEGEGLLILTPDESFFHQKQLKGLPITQLSDQAAMPSAEAENVMARAVQKVDERSRGGAYQAWLGFHNSVGGLASF